MSDFYVSVLAIAIVFFLITQLWLVVQVRFISSRLESLSPGGATRPTIPKVSQASNFAKFEHMVDNSFQRINVRVPATIQGRMTIGDRNVEVKMEDVSETGALVDCGGDVRLEVGSSYSLCFTLPGNEAIETKFHVARMTLQGNSYGGFFEGLSLGLKMKLKRYITEQARKELTSEIS